MAKDRDKKFYQRWWFWLIIIVVLFALFSNDDKEDPTTTDDQPQVTDETNVDEPDVTEDPADDTDIDEVEEDPTDQEDEFETIKSGTYKVGSDIPAGEYLVFADGMSYIESASDSTGELDSIIFNDNLMNDAHTYVTLNDGEYFKLQSGKMYPVDQAPSVIPDDGVYRDGMYKVGVDIEPGEYQVLLNEDAPLGMGYLEVTSSSSHRLEDIVTNDNIESNTYITVSEGQYLTLSNLRIEI